MGKVVETIINDEFIAEQKQYVYDTYNGKDYNGCIEHCDFLLRIPPSDKKSHKLVRNFCLRMKADCLKKTGKYKEALSCIDNAKQECGKDDYYKILYAESLIYKAMGDKEEALSKLDSTIHWYSRNDMYYELAKSLDTKADLLKSEELFLEAIRNYKLAAQESDWGYINKDKFYREFDSVYCRYIETLIHINIENQIKIHSALRNITNLEIKEEAVQKIRDAFGKEV